MSISVPPSTMARLDCAVELLNDAARNLAGAAMALQHLAPSQRVLIDNLCDQVLARRAAAKDLRDGCCEVVR